MAHFYGSVKGNKGEVTRLGSKDSGLETYAASWKGAIEVRLYDYNGEDWAAVSMRRHHGYGESRTLYVGPVGRFAPARLASLEEVIQEKLAAE